MKRHTDMSEAYVGGLYYSAEGSVTSPAADIETIDKWLNQLITPIVSQLLDVMCVSAPVDEQQGAKLAAAQSQGDSEVLKTLHDFWASKLKSPLPIHIARPHEGGWLVKCTAAYGGYEWCEALLIEMITCPQTLSRAKSF